jgi:beta-mannosidase
VDGYGRKKPLWYASRRFFADQLLTVQPTELGLKLALCNDTDTVWLGEVSVQRMTFGGNVRHAETLPLYVQPRSVTALELPHDLTHSDAPESECLIVQTGTQKATWFFLPDKELRYPAPVLEGRLEGETLTLTAQTLIRDLSLSVDRLHPEATVSDSLLTLLPGESASMRVTGLEGTPVEALLVPPVMNCANRFGKK